MPVASHEPSSSREHRNHFRVEDQSTNSTTLTSLSSQHYDHLDNNSAGDSSPFLENLSTQLLPKQHSSSRSAPSRKVEEAKQKLREAVVSSEQQRLPREPVNAFDHSLETPRRTSVDQLIHRFDKAPRSFATRALPHQIPSSLTYSRSIVDLSIRVHPSTQTTIPQAISASGFRQSTPIRLSGKMTLLPTVTLDSRSSAEPTIHAMSSNSDNIGQMAEEQQGRQASIVPEQPKLMLIPDPYVPQQRRGRWNKFGLFVPSFINPQSSDVAAQAYVNVPPHQQSPALESLIRFDVGHTSHPEASVATETLDHQKLDEKSQELSDDLPLDSDPATMPLPISREDSEEDTNPIKAPAVVPTPLRNESLQPMQLVPAIHVQAPSSVLDLPSTSTIDTSDVAAAPLNTPMSTPTIADHNPLPPRNDSTDTLLRHGSPQASPNKPGADQVDNDYLSVSLPLARSASPSVADTCRPNSPSTKKFSRRERFVKRTRKLLLKRRFLKLLLGRKHGRKTHGQVEHSQPVVTDMPISTLDGADLTSELEYRSPSHSVGLATSVLRPSDTTKQTLLPSQPRKASLSQSAESTPSSVSYVTPPKPASESRQKFQAQQDDQPQSASPLLRLKRKIMKDKSRLEQHEIKSKEKEAGRQQNRRRDLEVARDTLYEPALARHNQSMELMPRCQSCGKNFPSDSLSDALVLRTVLDQIKGMLQQPLLLRKPQKWLRVDEIDVSPALREDHECSCPHRLDFRVRAMRAKLQGSGARSGGAASTLMSSSGGDCGGGGGGGACS